MHTIVIPCLFAIVACSATGARTARTLKPGQAEVSVTWAAGAQVESDDDDTPEPYALIMPELGVRKGLSENVDLGFRIGTFMYYEADLKVRLHHGERTHIAVTPLVGYAFDILDDGAGRGVTGLGLIATYETTTRTALLAGIRGGPTIDFDHDQEVGYHGAGFLGFEARGKTAFIRPCLEAMMLRDRSEGMAVSLAVQLGGFHD